jgi:endonuclease/exonuclease/phosphatase family metal-dependent hydrolase
MNGRRSFFPVRFSACTYNIWTDTRWPERREALSAFGRLVEPDVLCLQEVQPESLATLDRALPKHRRVHDEFEGWSHEGNIFWRDDLFELESHGAEPVGILEPWRRLFWVRLSLVGGSGPSLFVSTAHFTWHGHEVCKATERNVRVQQARDTVAAIAHSSWPGEAVLFMGDLNDSGEPILLLRDEGFRDCFAELGQHSTFTYPAAPTHGGVPQSIDWIMCKGPVKPLLAHVIDFYQGDLAPSDHKAVMSVFEL